MSDITEKAVDVAADVVGEVAQQAEGVEQVIRSLSRVKISFASMGAVVGAAAGALAGYYFADKRLRTRYSEIADEEIAAMRQHFQDKVLAHENLVMKPPLDEIVEREGYSVSSTSPPLAVTPPQAVVAAAEEAREQEASAAAPVVEETEVEERNVFKDAEAPPAEGEWDYQREIRRRSPVKPYVIHIDELDEMPTYDRVIYTYYEGDDVLCNEGDDVVAEVDRDKLVGEENLGRFGHGSNDSNIVYIRNDRLEMQFEVVLSPNSYQAEVAGFVEHSNYPRRRGRQKFDDE